MAGALGTSKVLYNLYANSLGADNIYYAGSKAEEKAKGKVLDIYKTINELPNEIDNTRNVKYISEEFRAKALSVYLRASEGTQNEYPDFLEKLKNLPVARTEGEIKEFNKLRDEKIKSNEKIFKSSKKHFSTDDIKTKAKEVPFVDRSKYVERVLELTTMPGKKGTIYRNRAAALDTSIGLKNSDTAQFKGVYDELSKSYEDEGFKLKPEIIKYGSAYNKATGVPLAEIATETSTVVTAQEVEEEEEMPPAAQPQDAQPQDAQPQDAQPPAVIQTVAEVNLAEPEPVPDLLQPEQAPVIEQPQEMTEERRELLRQYEGIINDLPEEVQNELATLTIEKLTTWLALKENALAAQAQGNVDHDEADNNANDGLYGLRNNFLDIMLTSQQYSFQDFKNLEDLLKNQPPVVVNAALEKIRSKPTLMMAFDQNFLAEVIAGQDEAGNLLAAPDEIGPEVVGALGAVVAPIAGGVAGVVPEEPDAQETNVQKVEGSAPLVGTGSDSEKLVYKQRVHPDVLDIFFGNSSYPDWDPELENKIMSMNIPEARRIEIMDDIIQEYGKKIFIKSRKGSSKEELNELCQLQFTVMRNLQRGSRAKTANIKVSDLVKMQSLASGNTVPLDPNKDETVQIVPGVSQQEIQAGLNLKAAPKPQIIEGRGTEVTAAQVQTFNESKFIQDYSKLQHLKNLQKGPALQYPNGAPKIYPAHTPKTLNAPTRSAGIKTKFKGFLDAGKF